jgi:hypothetical protein
MNEHRFLAYVDLLGTTYSASTLATGYGSYIAQPILRKEVEGRENTLTEEEALGILDKCMKVLFYRDARSLNKVFYCAQCWVLSIADLLLIFLVSSGDCYCRWCENLGSERAGDFLGFRGRSERLWIANAVTCSVTKCCLTALLYSIT